MARNRWAHPTTAYQAVESTFLECRDLRHSWKTKTDFTVETRTIRGRKMKVYSRSLECVRCLLVRTDAFDHNLDRVALHYEYPEGYQVARTVEGQRGAKAVRAEVMLRGGVLAS